MISSYTVLKSGRFLRHSVERFHTQLDSFNMLNTRDSVVAEQRMCLYLAAAGLLHLEERRRNGTVTRPTVCSSSLDISTWVFVFYGEWQHTYVNCHLAFAVFSAFSWFSFLDSFCRLLVVVWTGLVTASALVAHWSWTDTWWVSMTRFGTHRPAVMAPSLRSVHA